MANGYTMVCKKNLVLVLCTILRTTMAQWEFPSDFEFGVATSAYQIEGGYNADGKGVSVWDRITQANPDFVADRANGEIACDSYHKWREDVEMVKNLGVNYYRFSISWTRILPNGFASKVNEPGVEYYNNLIDALKENGIEPFISLYHWDAPELFTALGLYYNDAFVDLFADYARLAFELFGDRVKSWITFNEPKVFCQDYNELMGSVNNYHPNGIIEYWCSYNIIKAHAKAYHIYNSEFRSSQQGKVGITLNFEWSEPATYTREDTEAAEQRRQFEFGLYANPIVYGDWPKIVKDRVGSRSREEGFPKSRLPKFTLFEKALIKGTYDFLGVNHYNSWLVAACPEVPILIDNPSVNGDKGTERFLDPDWPSTGWDAKVVPWGLRKALTWMKQTYQNPEIRITECGYPDQTATLEDNDRINFLQQYLNATLEALIEDKVRVKTFTVWSLMDNFEWGQGYRIKFGLYHVNFDDPDRPRTAKKSVEYVKTVIQSRRV